MKDSWTGADWSNAMQGESGELAEVIGALVLGNSIATHTGLIGNLVKKLRRNETSIQQAEGPTEGELLENLATEIGDVFLYLDLLAQYYGLSMSDCVIETFNRVSQREGFPEILSHEDNR
jgi:NTP pyrophosphatase (non-canonical NTP hydrolase)